jgi:hypothetical protein
MSEIFKEILGLACFVPLVIGLLRYKKIDKKYYPFIYMMVADCAIELLVSIFNLLPSYKGYKGIFFNIYLPCYFFLSLEFTWLNKFISKKVKKISFVASLPVLLFNLWVNNWVFIFPFYYLSYMSTIMLFIFTNILSMQVLAVNNRLKYNFWFWVSSFSILYHAFTLLIFGLYFFSLFDTPNGRSILEIHHYVNALSYIAFAFAILIIPAKNNFSISKQH